MNDMRKHITFVNGKFMGSDDDRHVEGESFLRIRCEIIHSSYMDASDSVVRWLRMSADFHVNITQLRCEGKHSWYSVLS